MSTIYRNVKVGDKINYLYSNLYYDFSLLTDNEWENLKQYNISSSSVSVERPFSNLVDINGRYRYNDVTLTFNFGRDGVGICFSYNIEKKQLYSLEITNLGHEVTETPIPIVGRFSYEQFLYNIDVYKNDEITEISTDAKLYKCFFVKEETNAKRYLNETGLSHLVTKIKQLINNSQRYKVGDLFMTTNEDNPADRFGGTWKKLDDDAYLKIASTKGKFEEGKAGVVNGTSSVHKIPIESMPSHTHSYTNPGGSYSNTNIVGGTGIVPQTNPFSTNTGSSGRGDPYYPWYYSIYVWVKIAD